MKFRSGICLIGGLVMMLWALPYLSFQGSMEERLFSMAWLALAFSVLAGNLSAVLYGEGRAKAKVREQTKDVKKHYVSRQYKRLH